MATIIELKEHLEKGGKIRRPCWGKGAYVYYADTGFTDEDECYFYDKQLFLDDWEVYEESKKKFEILYTGLYETRDGRKAFVSVVKKEGCIGIIEGENHIRLWDKSGLYWEGHENPVDIVAEWED